MTSLFIRNVPDDVAIQIHKAASARGITISEYLTLQNALVNEMRLSRSENIQALLAKYDLQLVTL